MKSSVKSKAMGRNASKNQQETHPKSKQHERSVPQNKGQNRFKCEPTKGNVKRGYEKKGESIG